MTLKEMAALCGWSAAPETEAEENQLTKETMRRLLETLQAQKQKEPKQLTLYD